MARRLMSWLLAGFLLGLGIAGDVCPAGAATGNCHGALRLEEAGGGESK